ncbi:MAG: ABC transporter ATP-binding protein [Candidatus Rokuibacteriota bacterium]
MLRAVGLRKVFRGPDGRLLEILRGVDLTLAPGEHVAVVGRSGSGKSTLLNLLGCLDRADGGQLWFGDTCLTRAGRQALARFRGRQLGFVFQAFHLIASLTAWENVLLAARYVDRDRAEAARLFERLGIADRRDHYPPALSGGAAAGRLLPGGPHSGHVLRPSRPARLAAAHLGPSARLAFGSPRFSRHPKN